MFKIRQDAALVVTNINQAEPEKIQHEDDNPTADVKPVQSTGQGRIEVKPIPRKAPSRRMRPWKVVLHNDDVNDQLYVVETIMKLTPLNKYEAIIRMLEAHTKGKTMLLTTHRERAELYWEQFAGRGLVVTIRPA